VQRQGDRASTFPNPRGVQVLAQLASDQGRFILEKIQRKREGKGPAHHDRAIGATDDDAVDAMSVEGEAEDAGVPGT
jgi:hypothetical protein